MRKQIQNVFAARPIFIAVLFALSGCGSPDWFQPPPQLGQVWTKPGSSSTEISKALLECGSVSVSSLAVPPREGKTPNQKAQIQRCMFADGFKMTVPKKQWYYCETSPSLPACDPGASVVQRSVPRRLQSNYCRSKSDLKFCLRTAVNKYACTQTERRFPPECRR